ncbi:hypothetical protein C7999DRAFT_14994 [Corynascus novoguineensis]|uniref:Uncharacterized protein n=1 Tax=Corynascus novoguineensis TaxID=1126955 RepID=A0AAN7HN57_9PEZI|nr:hypothetical protein C7999DRAFT_14994 [Corynascus novoguineensis]
MICRACLRARSALAADAFPAQKLLQSTQRRLLSTAIARLRPATAVSRALYTRLPQPPSRCQFFSTSTSMTSVAAQPQEPSSAAASPPEKPTYLSEGESQIWDILVTEFAPTQLVVQDISGGCGSMYGIEICSEKFRGLNMLKQQRLVNAALGDLMNEWHGVQLKTRGGSRIIIPRGFSASNKIPALMGPTANAVDIRHDTAASREEATLLPAHCNPKFKSLLCQRGALSLFVRARHSVSTPTTSHCGLPCTVGIGSRLDSGRQHVSAPGYWNINPAFQLQPTRRLPGLGGLVFVRGLTRPACAMVHLPEKRRLAASSVGGLMSNHAITNSQRQHVRIIVQSTNRSNATTQGGWVHTPSTAILLWMAVSLPLVIWDTVYMLLRPHTMPGGQLHEPLWVPYALYGEVDHMYGFKQWHLRNPFAAGQSVMNAVETLLYLVYLGLWYAYGQPPAPGARRAVGGRVGGLAVLVGFSAAVMTISKTVLYWLLEYLSGFDNIGHNDLFRLVFLWIIPNGAWIIVPLIFMIFGLGSELIDGLTRTDSAKKQQ